MRLKHALLVILTGALASGCLKSTTTIELKPDGSGTIVQENAVTAEALAMIKGFAASQNTKEVPQDLFSQEQALKTAEQMGVTFVSGEPTKTATHEGYRALYKFDDITRIKFNMQQGPESVAGAASGSQPPFGFTFSRGASSSLLTIQMPEQAPGAFPGMPKGTSDADKAQAAQAMAMMKMMLKGMFVDVSLALDGRIIKSNATHVDGSKITLLQMDFDKMIADDAAMQKLEAATDLKALANVPGLKIATDPKLVIEFGR
jgi:hypothetical protein